MWDPFYVAGMLSLSSLRRYASRELSLPLSLLDHQVNRRIVQIELSAFVYDIYNAS